jgi:hypothetical protein
VGDVRFEQGSRPFLRRSTERARVDQFSLVDRSLTCDGARCSYFGRVSRGPVCTLQGGIARFTDGRNGLTGLALGRSDLVLIVLLGPP